MGELNSRYVLSDRTHYDLERMLDVSGKFQRVYIDKEAEISDREQTVTDKEWSQAKQSREANALKATYEDLLKKLETREQRLTFKEQILTNACCVRKVFCLARTTCAFPMVEPWKPAAWPCGNCLCNTRAWPC